MLRQRLLPLLLLVSAPTLQAANIPNPSQEQLQQWLQVSTRRSALMAEGAQPFHLAATIETFDAQGAPAGNTTVDELWRDPLSHKLTETMPDRTLVEVDNGTSAWRTGNYTLDSSASSNAAELIFFFLQPFEQRNLETKRVQWRPDFYKTTNLDCIGTQPELPDVPPEQEVAETTFCMAQGNHILRRLDSPRGVQISFDDIAAFGNHYVARTVSMSHGNILLARMHITSLEAATDFAALDAPAPDGAQVFRARRQDVFGSGALMRGQLLTRGLILSLKHNAMDPTLMGKMALLLHIDKQGTVTDVDVENSSNPVMTTRVVLWAKRLRYRASYQNSQLVPVTMHFSFDFGGQD